MNMKIEQFPATNPNPVLNVAKDGVILYSNEAGDPLLHEWGVKVGEKLPFHIGDIVQRVISLNNPEKMEIKAGNIVYLVVFSPLPEQECVNISGFDITNCKPVEEALQKSRDEMESQILKRTAELQKSNEDLIIQITERKRAEEELTTAHSQIQKIIDNMPDLIYVFDQEERFVLANVAVANVLNSTPDRMIGKRRHEFMPKNDADWHEANDRQAFEAGRALEFEEYSHLEDRSITWLTKKFPLRNAQGRIDAVSGISADITERKRAEEALKIANETLEKRVKERTEELNIAYESLRNLEIVRKREIHHRIKNNLQVISSLLDLQAEKFRDKSNIENSQVLEAFKESKDRVISMALIHEELHKDGELDTLNFSLYIKQLVDNLFISYKLGNEGTSLDIDIEEDIFFEMDTAIPLGIIVNELISNSLKYAFFDRDKGEITIRLYREDNRECEIEGNKNTNYVLSVSDNGIGIPEDLDIEDLDSLGLQLVTALIEQLEGELKLKNNKGTEFTIRFTVPESNNPKLAKRSLQLTDND